MTPLSVTAARVETARVWRRRAILCAIVALRSWEGTAQGLQEPDHQKTVLALYSTRRGTPSAVLLDSALERTLGTGLAGRLDFHVEYIDLARFTEPGYQLSLRDFLRAKYAQYKFDLVIATSDYDLDFATRYRDDLFPGVPLVFSSSPGSSPFPNATGVVSDLNLRDTVQIATTIQPDVRRVVVVSGASAVDKSYEAIAREQFKPFEGRLVFTYLSGLPISELLRQVAQLPADSMIYYLTVFEDGNGDKFIGADGLEKIAAVASVPMYTWHIIGLDRGIVGGSLISMEALARRLAELGLRVLGGERADAIAITEFDPNVVAFDWRQLQRWQIDERRLPSGSVVRFRQPTTWERYKAYIITAAAVLGLQTMFIAGLLFQRARRRRVEAALRQNQQRYALATVAGAVGVWDWNLDTNRMYVDPQLKQLLGYRDDEIRNHLDAWRQQVHPDDREAVRARAQACIDDGLDAYELEHRMLHKNGSLRWFVARGSIMKRADGTPYRIVGTDTDITERKRAEQEIHENEAALRASNEEIQNLAGRLIVAQEVERTRIARDLHDDVSQQLAGISIALSNLKRHVGRQTEAEEQVQGALTSLQQRTIALAENIRFLSHDLHPGVLTHAGLVAALKGHCDELRRQHAINVTFRADDDLGAIGPEAELCLYRVAQEVLGNTVRHAQASQASVLLVRSISGAELTITDDGKGFDAARSGGRSSGLGLLSINERVRLAGGTVRVMTELNKGTSVRVRIPIKADSETGRSDGPEHTAPSEGSVSHAS